MYLESKVYLCTLLNKNYLISLIIMYLTYDRVLRKTPKKYIYLYVCYDSLKMPVKENVILIFHVYFIVYQCSILIFFV